MPSGNTPKPRPISSSAQANCRGRSTFQPWSRKRANQAASSGPPITITTVLMFCTHCGAMRSPNSSICTLPTANSCRPLGAIWISDQNTSEPKVSTR